MPMKSDYDIVKQWKKHHKITKDGLGKQFRNTQDCQAFYAGDMMDYWIGAQSQDQMGVRKRAMVQINKVKPYVNAVKGFMAQNRRKAKYSARMDGNKIQEVFSTYANGMSDYVRRTAFADQKETQQDGDMLINGYGAIETAITYSNGHATTDPNGRIIKGRLDPLCVGWDPFAKETNLIDKRWVYSEHVYDLSDAIELFQDSREDDFESATDDDMQDGDGNYKFYARGGRYNKIRESALDWSDERNEKVKVFFYQWYQYEEFFRCENPTQLLKDPMSQVEAQTQLEIIAQEHEGEIDDLFAFDPKADILNFNAAIKKDLIKVFGDDLPIYEYRRKTFYTAVISKDHIFTKFRNPCQQGFTIKFKTGDYDSKNKIWTGMVNSMKEPVLYYSKALTELMFIIGSNSKGGVYYEEDAVDDPQLFEQQYAKTDAAIMVNAGAISGARPKIMPKKEAQAVTGYENIIDLMGKDTQDVNGFDKSFLGSTENKGESGKLFRMRIRQCMAALACYFDSISLYQIEDAMLMLDFMRIWAENNDGGLFSLIGSDGREQFLQISANKLAPEYDVKMDEAPQSPEDKQEFAMVLTSIADKLMEGDMATAKAIYGIASKYLPLDYEDQQKLMTLLVPQKGTIDPAQYQKLVQQVQQLTSQLHQAQLGEVVSKTNLNNAKARLDAAKITEVGATVIEKKASAVHQLHEGLMDEHLAKQPDRVEATT